MTRDEIAERQAARERELRLARQATLERHRRWQSVVEEVQALERVAARRLGRRNGHE